MALLRRRRNELHALEEDEVYARSYGERSDDVTNVKPMPPQEENEEKEEEAEPRLTDRKIRDAFRARLDRREPG